MSPWTEPMTEAAVITFNYLYDWSLRKYDSESTKPPGIDWFTKSLKSQIKLSSQMSKWDYIAQRKHLLISPSRPGFESWHSQNISDFRAEGLEGRSCFESERHQIEPRKILVPLVFWKPKLWYCLPLQVTNYWTVSGYVGKAQSYYWVLKLLKSVSNDWLPPPSGTALLEKLLTPADCPKFDLVSGWCWPNIYGCEDLQHRERHRQQQQQFQKRPIATLLPLLLLLDGK